MPKRCTESPIGIHWVESDTTTKTYEVRITQDGKNTCNCTGFVTKRNKLGGLSAIGMPDCTCKHIKAILAANGCGWDSQTGATQAYPNVCPVCSSPTEDYDAPVGDVDDEMMTEALASLLALRDRMKA